MMTVKNMKICSVIFIVLAVVCQSSYAEPPARLADFRMRDLGIEDRAAMLWNSAWNDLAQLKYDDGFTKYLELAELTKTHPVCEYFLGGLNEMQSRTYKNRRPELKALLEKLLADDKCLPTVKTVISSMLMQHYFRSGELDKAEKIIAKMGFVREWILIGAFDNEGKAGLNAVYPPEQEFDIEATYKGKVRDVKWRDAGAYARFGFVDLGAQILPSETACAYSAVMVEVKDAKDSVPAAFRFGSKDAIAIWLNGKEVFRRDVYRSLSMDQDAVGVMLEPGWNLILVKVTTGAGGDEERKALNNDGGFNSGRWGFYFRITDPDGSSLDNLNFASNIKAMAGIKHADPGKDTPEIKPNLEMYLKDLVVKKENYALAHYLLGHVLDSSRSFDENEHPERDAFEKAAKLEPKAALFWYRLALAEPVHNKSLEYLKKAVEVDKNFAPGYVALSMRYSRMRDKSKKYLEEAARINPEDPEVLMSLKRISFDENRLRENFERKAMLEICEKYPNVPVWQAYKDMQFEGTVEEYKARYEKEIKENFMDYGARKWILSYHMRRGEYDEVDKEYELMSWLYPYDIDNILKRAALARNRGDKEKAIGFMKDAVKIRPESSSLHALLGEYYHWYKMEKEANAEWDFAGELRKSFPELAEYREIIAPHENVDMFEKDYASDFADVIKQKIDVAKYKDDGAVWLLNRCVTKVNEDGTSMTLIEKVIRIMNEKGAREYQTVDAGRGFHADSNLVKTQIKTAYVIKKDGRKLDADFVRDSHVFTLPPLDPGDTIVVRSRTDTIGEPLYKQYFGDRFYLQESLGPLMKAEYTLVLPKDRKFNFQHARFEGKPQVQEKNGAVIVTWVAENLKKIVPEPNMPSMVEILPVINVSTFKSWDETAEWVRGILVDAFESNKELEQKTDELVKDKKTREEKLRAIYEFVANEIRYESFPLENHGYRPFKAFQTFVRKWGDCKDKAVLMMTMLKHAGIKSYFVVVRASDPGAGTVETDVPAMHLFNHAIVYVPSEDGKSGMFLDGTAQRCPMGIIPDMDQGAIMFIVREKDGFLTYGPMETPGDNIMRWESEVLLDKNGGAKVKIQGTGSGQSDMIIRLYFQEGGQRREMLEREYNRYFNGVTINEKSMKFSDLRKLDEPAKMEFAFEVPKFAKGKDSRFRIRANFIPSELIARYATIAKRDYDCVIGLPDRVVRKVRYIPPEGYKFSSYPKNVSIENKWAKYELSYSLSGNGELEAELIRESRTPRISAKEYEAFRAFCQEVEKFENQEIILQKK